jgi:hypothetical protein
MHDEDRQSGARGNAVDLLADRTGIGVDIDVRHASFFLSRTLHFVEARLIKARKHGS